MNYRIIEALDKDTLVKEVNAAIADGYEPIGSPVLNSGKPKQAVCRVKTKAVSWLQRLKR